MEVIVEALKVKKPYDELKELYERWETAGKMLLFLDLSIVHQCSTGVKLIGDLEGPEIYLQPYDEYDRVTPIYVAQLLSKISETYNELSEYMLTRIKLGKSWDRRKGTLWVLKRSKQAKRNDLLFRLPKSLQRYTIENFM